MRRRPAIRKRVITADDGQSKIIVTIRVECRQGLTRDEHDMLTESAASQVMGIMPGLRYFNVPSQK